jgi:hypothetical protein
MPTALVCNKKEKDQCDEKWCNIQFPGLNPRFQDQGKLCFGPTQKIEPLPKPTGMIEPVCPKMSCSHVGSICVQGNFICANVPGTNLNKWVPRGPTASAPGSDPKMAAVEGTDFVVMF